MLKLKLAVVTLQVLTLAVLGGAIYQELGENPPPTETPEPTFPEVSEWPPAIPTPHLTALCGAAGSVELDLLIQEAAEEAGIEPAMLAAVVAQESRCRPTALGGAGEVGLGQIHPHVWTRTLKKEGLIQGPEDLWEPETNLRCAAYILSRQVKRSKSTWSALRRYNGAGPKARHYADEVSAKMAAITTK